MFPSAKRRKNTPSGKPPQKAKEARSPKRPGPGGQQHKGKTGKAWKKSRDGEKTRAKKMKPGGKTFGVKKAGSRENKFGGNKKFEGNKKDKFRSKGQKAKRGFKKNSAGAKQGFKQRKGKG